MSLYMCIWGTPDGHKGGLETSMHLSVTMMCFSGSLWLEWGLRGTQEEMDILGRWTWLWIRVLLTGSESLTHAFVYKSLFRQWEGYRCRTSGVLERVKDDPGWDSASVCLSPYAFSPSAWKPEARVLTFLPELPNICFFVSKSPKLHVFKNIHFYLWVCMCMPCMCECLCRPEECTRFLGTRVTCAVCDSRIFYYIHGGVWILF